VRRARARLRGALRGAGAYRVAPEGVAVWAVACRRRCRCGPVAPEGVAFARWRCRCLSGGPRGGRRLGGGVGPGFPSGGAGVLRGAPGLRRGAPVGLRRAPVVLRSACLQIPWGRLAAPPRGVGLSVPWSGLPRPRGGLVCRAVGGPSGCPSEEGRLGGPGRRAAGCIASPRRGGGAGCFHGSASRGGWAHFGPRWRCGLGGQAPPVRVAAGLRPSEEGRARCFAG
jgi:hypothetical protein